MAKKATPRFSLETSAVIFQLHGHSLMQAAVTNAIDGGRVEVSWFVRMEYLRGFILNLIEFYFLMEDSECVSDALIEWSQKVRQERKLKIVLMTISRWIVDQEDWQAKDKSLRRLGDEIVRLVYAFDEAFPQASQDHLRCQLGRIHFPKRTFDPAMLLDFYDRFRMIQQSVSRCHLCRFRDHQRRSLEAKGIDLFSASRRTEFRAFKGYVTQAERLEATERTTETAPKCRWCEQVGDSIIALQTHRKEILLTADRAFVPFGQILAREIRLLPSLAELKRQAQAQESGESSSPSS
jgi:hypothetical protein